jgi:ATP-binding cassette, subfamily B, bacterial
VTGIGTLQSSGATNRALAHFRALGQRRKRANMIDQITGRVIDSLRGNLIAVGTGGIMLLGASRLQSGALSVGDFVLFVMYFTFVTDYVSDLGQFLAHFRQTSVAIDRLNVLADDPDPFVLANHTPIHIRGALPPEPETDRSTGVPRLERMEVDGLTCQHADGEQGVFDVSFAIERGQLVVVTGLVGAGKSTLLRALMGLLPIDGGTIR